MTNQEDVAAESDVNPALRKEYDDVMSKLAMLEDVEKNLVNMSREELKVSNTD